MSSLFKSIPPEYLSVLEAELRDLLTSAAPIYREYYGMMQYHMGWRDAELRPRSGHSGKRIRPLLCLLACEAAGGILEQALPAAAGIEILHNFSLLHDDIEDNSHTRRGRPTVWKVWGEPQAINVGDGMFALAHLAFARLPERGVPAQRALAALRTFDETCLSLTHGQYLDIRFENQLDVSVEAYLTMISNKTAALVATSTYLGALLSGAGEMTAGHYRDFGYHLGLAFQVRDDILGIWGEESVTGKSTSSDIETRKKTLPVVYGLEKSPELRRLYASERIAPGHVQRVVRILNDLDARSMVEMVAQEHHQKATRALERSAAAGQAGKALKELADSLLNRVK